MAFPIPSRLVNLRHLSPPPPPPSWSSSWKGKRKKIEKVSFLAYCEPLQQHSQLVENKDVAILCEPCNGKGWLLCSFCEGQKTNVKSENNRIYRRCPSCRAIGYVLCSKCKVFKCVTFPDFADGEL